MSTTIPFDETRTNDILVVSVRGDFEALPDVPKGWRHVLENFFYECSANDNISNRRAATKFVAFYRSHSPMAITHWAQVSKITEKNDTRRYHLSSISKLKTIIPKGSIPPNFSGGGVALPIEIFFKIKNTDELYEKYRN